MLWFQKGFDAGRDGLLYHPPSSYRASAGKPAKRLNSGARPPSRSFGEPRRSPKGGGGEGPISPSESEGRARAEEARAH
jgi:hypothetical protein